MSIEQSILPKQQKSEAGNRKLIDRRRFIKVAGGGLAAATVLNAVPQVAEAQSANKVERPDTLEEKKLREEWQKFKKIVESQKVKENSEFVNRELRDFAQELIFRANLSLAKYEILCDFEESGGDVMQEPSVRVILEELVDDLNKYWNKDLIRTRGEQAQSPVVFEGFEKLPSINVEKLKADLEGQYGKAWLDGTVDKIVYVDELRSRKTFQVAGEAVGRTLDSAFMNSSEQIIYLYKDDNLDIDSIIKIIAHELGHQNDWIGASNITLSEKLEFLRDVLERRKSDDFIKYEYVEVDLVKEAQAEDWSPEVLHSSQAQEYWAVLCGEYFTQPMSLLLKSPKDFALVSKWYDRINGK